MFEKILSRNKHHLICFALILIIGVIYFLPGVKGKSLSQDDIKSGIGMSKSMIDYRESHDDNPLWNQNAFGGTPDFVMNVKFPNRAAKHFPRKFFRYFGGYPGNIILLGLVCSFLMLISFRINPYLSLAGAIGIAFGTYSIMSLVAGHNSKVATFGLLPLFIAGFNELYHKRYYSGTAALLIVTTISIIGHFQILYYGAIMFAFYFVGLILEAGFKDLYVDKPKIKRQFSFILGGALLFVMILYFITNQSDIVLHVTFALFIKLTLFALGRSIYKKQHQTIVKTLSITFLCAIVGGLTNTAKLWTSLEYNKHSIRGKYLLTKAEQENNKQNLANYRNSSGLDANYVFQYSAGNEEFFTYLIPNFFGGGSFSKYSETEFFENYSNNLAAQGDPDPEVNAMKGIASQMYFGKMGNTGGPSYFGAVFLFLFVFAMMTIDLKHRFWMILTLLFFTLVSMGKFSQDFNLFLFNHFPLYSSFRTVSMAMMIPIIGVVLGALLGVKKIFETENKNVFINPLIIAASITGAICLLAILIPDYGASLYKNGDHSPQGEIFAELRGDAVVSDGMRSLAYILISFGILYMYVKGKMKYQKYVLGVIATLGAVDMLGVSLRYISHSDFQEEDNQEYFVEFAGEKAIKKDTDPHFRVISMGNPFADYWTPYHFRAFGGYHPAKLRRAQDIYEHYLQYAGRNVLENLGKKENKLAVNELVNNYYLRSNKGTANVINMLDIKYALFTNPRQRMSLHSPINNNLGAAWFVNNLLSVKSNDEEIGAINNIEPKETAILNTSEFSVSTTNFGSGNGKIELKKYSNNEIIYQSNNSKKGFAVFSEIWYPHGWHVTIDGQPASHVRVNYLLRGMEVPAGQHTIKWTFMPTSYRLGSMVSTISFWLVILLCLGCVFMAFKKQNKKKAIEEGAE